MRRLDWVHTVIRLIGVLFIGLSVPGVINLGPALLDAFASASAFGGWSGRPNAVLIWGFWILAALSQFLFGLYLVFGGKAVFRLCVKDVPWMCSSCGYDVHGVTGDRCPECGKALETPSTKRGHNS